ncbi:hypothetical protein Taro_006276 [Colocasia esculenta]|uniref:Phytocyanin domain-containing protein n=1 Tax=Colocasia esculenta TaxID=4460 RepID=A0A843U0A2_COLES|nr:hypothetical protein [Colocasia esculenta]
MAVQCSLFRYKKGEDSVLVVTEPAYSACDTSNPIRRLDGGDSVFQFDHSGPFYFISGVPKQCQVGQKLVVVVLSPWGRQPETGLAAASRFCTFPSASFARRSAAASCFCTFPSASSAGRSAAAFAWSTPPALPPLPAAVGLGGAAPSAPPSELPRAPGQALSWSSSQCAPFQTAIAALALAGATFLFI